VELARLSSVLIDRLLELETDAAHLTALAAVADAYAYVAREKADQAQRALSEIKVFLALLPADTAFELKAPRPGADRQTFRCASGTRHDGDSRSGRGTGRGDDAEAYFGAWSRARLGSTRAMAAANLRSIATPSRVPASSAVLPQGPAGGEADPLPASPGAAHESRAVASRPSQART
jgi:hypothetical protein